jgi:hypothetical protein
VRLIVILLHVVADLAQVTHLQVGGRRIRWQLQCIRRR